MSMPDPVVILLDDDPSVCRALSRVLRLGGHAVEVCRSAEEFLARSPVSGPACLVLDIRMPGISGMELQSALSRQVRSEEIVFITGHADVSVSVQAMKAGAVDFLLKPFNNEDLLNAVAAALKRSAERWDARLQRQKARSRVDSLTPREFEVLQFVISGFLNKQIGAELGVAEKTVKVHRGRVMEKLNVTSVAALVNLAELAGVSPASGSRS